MLSGIGNGADLRALNIDAHMHVPELGRDVQDHILHAGCPYQAREPFILRNSSSNVSGDLRTKPRLELPDVSIIEIELPLASDATANRYDPPPTSFALCAGLITPKSRGTVKLRSTDPAGRRHEVPQPSRRHREASPRHRGGPGHRKLSGHEAFLKREVAPGHALEDQELFVRS